MNKEATYFKKRKIQKGLVEIKFYNYHKEFMGFKIALNKEMENKFILNLIELKGGLK